MPDNIESPEAIRQETLDALEIFDTPPEAEFDAVVAAARRIFDCGTAYISLINAERQWFKARIGFEPSEVPRDRSICAIAVDEGREILVEDLQAHPDFGAMPDIAASPDLRFYVSIPLMGPYLHGDRAPIGTLCVVGDTPHQASEEQLAELRQLCQLVEALFRMRLDAKMARRASAERKSLVEHLRRMQRQFELAEEMAQIGHWRLDLETNEVFWSRQTLAIHGIEELDENTLTRALEFFLPHDRARLEAALRACREDGVPYDLELDFRDTNGVLKRVHTHGEIEKIDGCPVAMIGVFQDITERYHLETRLRAAAHVDDLTGLPNRARLNGFLDEAIIRKRKHGRDMAVVLIDLDHFKEVNDEHGHEAGDRVLKKVAGQLVGHPFSGQLAARLGGDEFVLVIEDEKLLADLPGTLDTLLAKLRFEVAGSEGSKHAVSATLGASWLTAENAERSALLRCADYALYQAKRAQRGTAAICPESIAGEHAKRPNLRVVG